MPVAHIVLFRPKADLAAGDRESLVGAIERVHRDISVIRSFRVGKRVLRDIGYAAMVPEYPFLALIEVDDRRALQEYLAHPAHADLARWFWTTGDSALAYDFELSDASTSRDLL